MSDNHELYMRHALRLAKRTLGNVAPNPAVGCVIVSEYGQIIGQGWTQIGGRPHAETSAIANAKKYLAANKLNPSKIFSKSTLYVTLEPCCHYGKTPPCTDAIIANKIGRVVIACIDDNPKMAGKAIAILQDAGIDVVTGILLEEARQLNAGFFLNLKYKRPLIALKTAISIDGKIALSNGVSQWLTSQLSRNYAHSIRAKYDAILVGSGTVIADNPRLDCRMKGLEDYSPIPAVISSNPASWLNENCNLLKRDSIIVITTSDKKNLLADLERRYPNIVFLYADYDKKYGSVVMKSAMEKLVDFGITRVLVEGGAKIAKSLLQDNMIDEIYAFHAPVIIGDDGIGAVSELNYQDLLELHVWQMKMIQPIHDSNDYLVHYQQLSSI